MRRRFELFAASNPPTPPTPPPASLIAVTVAPNSATLLLGATQAFTASVTGTTNTAVTWSVQESFGGTIDSTGLYTAPQNLTGTFHVVATSKANPASVGSAAVAVQLTQLTISPTTVIVPPGGTQAFMAGVTGFANPGVTWTIQETGGGIINSAGLYTAPSTEGFYHVIVTSVQVPTVSASATISVTTSLVSFFPTGSLQKARGFHTATLLNNGELLVAGGANKASDPQCIGGIVSAELYDANAGASSPTGASTPTGALTAPRNAHTATLLPNGEVLVAGGFGDTSNCQGVGAQAQNTAELYDPDKGSFSATGNMSVSRGAHTATLLQGGKVLIAGGEDQGVGGTGSASAELYDPNTGAFTQTGSMAVARFRHFTATLLNDGKGTHRRRRTTRFICPNFDSGAL